MKQRGASSVPRRRAPNSSLVTAPVHTNISAAQRMFPVGGDVSIPCQADGYPIPKVTWYKDGMRLDPSDTIRISGELSPHPRTLALSPRS